MGTPGDKAEIGKVVQESQLDPDQEATPSSSERLLVVPQPSTSALPAEMGRISRLPQFETFSAIDIHPSVSQTTASKPESFQVMFFKKKKNNKIARKNEKSL